MAAVLRARLAGGLRVIINGYGIRPQYQGRSLCKAPPDDAKPADVKASLTAKKQDQIGDKPVTTEKVEESVSEEKLLTAKKSEESVIEENLQTTQKDNESPVKEEDFEPSHKSESVQVVEEQLSKQKEEIRQTVKEPLKEDKHDQSDGLVTDQKVKEILTDKKQEQSLDSIVTAQKVEANVTKEEKETVQKSKVLPAENKQGQSNEFVSAQNATEITKGVKEEPSVDRLVTSQEAEGFVTKEEQNIAQSVEGIESKQEQETVQNVEDIVAKEEQETVHKTERLVVEEPQETFHKVENVFAKEELETIQKVEGVVAEEPQETFHEVEKVVANEEQETVQKVEGLVAEEPQETLHKVENIVAKEELETVQKVEGLVAEEPQETLHKVENIVAKGDLETVQKVEGLVAEEPQETLHKVEKVVAKEEQETIQKVEGVVAEEEIHKVEKVVAKEELDTAEKVEGLVAEELRENLHKAENVVAKEELDTVQKVEGVVAEEPQETLHKVELVAAKEELDTVQKVEGLATKEEQEAIQKGQEVVAKEGLETVQNAENLVKEEQETGLKVQVPFTKGRHDQSDKAVTAQKVEIFTDMKHEVLLDRVVPVQEVEGFVTEEQEGVQKAEVLNTKEEESNAAKVEPVVVKEKQETAQVKEEEKVEDKKEVAQKKLHDLLTSLATADPIPVEPVVKLSRPKARPKKKTKPEAEDVAAPPPPEKLIEPELVSATEEVAESLGGDVEGTKLELLSALRSHSSDIAKSEKPAMSMSELFMGMKVERSQSKPVKEYPRRKRFDRELETRSSSYGSNVQQQKMWSKTSSAPRPRTLSRVDLFGAEPLGIFSATSSEKDREAALSATLLPVWEAALRREKQLCVTHPPVNAFTEMIQWTNQGMLWTFPIDNEFGLEDEKKVGFHEHVFLERHLEGWCPKRGPIRHFMELVCTGLSKNPYLTVERKCAHIEWYKNYFAEKEDLLKEIGAIDAS